ncbi:MAG TPA: ABC transporter permease [Anaerolineales bacterium]|nr:ABC transporter permease [Anaerolineales bacterium]
MKILDIAFKDMTRSFRSAFALIFMFGIPLLMTGMFYFMFGGGAKGSQGFSVPVTQVVVANLDQGGQAFDQTKAQFPGGSQAHSLGDMVLDTLQNKSFADLMNITRVDSSAAARQMVDDQKAGVAIIIPADFSQQFTNLNGHATVQLYKDPTLTLGPSIVESIMTQFMDSMSGAKVAVEVVTQQSGSHDPALIGQVVQQYVMGVPSGDQTATLLDLHAPAAKKSANSTLSLVVSFIMGGMTIFYAFFTGTSTAQSILREDEDGTLPRLFTTPTTQATVLGGKFLAIGLTVLVQMTVLLILGRLIFAIQWGSLLPLALITLGTVLAAATFGIFIISLLKSTRQAGTVLGGVLTVTGMLGMIKIFTMGSPTSPAWADIASMFVPQGWAVRGLSQVMGAASMNDILLTCLALLGMSIVFFLIGVLRFQKRFA